MLKGQPSQNMRNNGDIALGQRKGMTARKGVAAATTMPDLLKRTGTGSPQEGLAASSVAHSVGLLSTGGIALSGMHLEL